MVVFRRLRAANNTKAATPSNAAPDIIMVELAATVSDETAENDVSH
jgi:hypothetical protein